jgi:hypothetical protein
MRLAGKWTTSWRLFERGHLLAVAPRQVARSERELPVDHQASPNPPARRVAHSRAQQATDKMKKRRPRSRISCLPRYCESTPNSTQHNSKSMFPPASHPVAIITGASSATPKILSHVRTKPQEWPQPPGMYGAGAKVGPHRQHDPVAILVGRRAEFGPCQIVSMALSGICDGGPSHPASSPKIEGGQNAIEPAQNSL